MKKRVIKITAITQAQLIKLLLEGDMTCRELAEETGLHYVTVLHYTRELYLAKAAHITRWEQDSLGRDLIKVYKLGPGKDAKRRKLTAVERSLAYRTKQRMAKILHITAGHLKEAA